MRILVTGHLGYIGAVLVPMAQQAGHTVVGLDSDLYAGCDFGRPTPSIRTIGRDVRDVTVDDLKDVDGIIHLAALSNDPLGDLDPALTDAINHVASLRLATLARDAGVRRFVFSSSCSNYGSAGEDLVDEDATLRPLTPYAVSKVRVEDGLVRLADGDFTPVMLRNATAYGASPRLRCDLVLNDLVGWAHTTGRILVRSDGTPWRPLVHVADIAAASLAALEAPRAVVHAEAFNVGRTDENFRVSEIAEIVRATIPGAQVTYAEGAGPDTRSYRVSFEKIRRALPSLTLSWTVAAGARELADAYRDRGLDRADLEGSRYRRVDRIRADLRTGRLDADLRPRGAE